MSELTYHTAGESHGPALTVLVEGLPAGLRIDVDLINSELRRRQGGYGRGGRMAIEHDAISVLSGARRGVTIGSPITLQLPNKDCRIDFTDVTIMASRWLDCNLGPHHPCQKAADQ